LPDDWFNRLLGMLVIIASFVLAWFLMDYHDFTRSHLKLPDRTVTYQLKPGSSINSIARQFKQNGWISNSTYLKICARLNHISAIKAGEYEFDDSMTPLQLLEKMSRGEVLLHQVTFIEGWTFKQMLQALQQNAVLDKTLEGKTQAEIMQLLGEADMHPEGLFLPDTYAFSRGMSDLQILQAARQAMRTRLEQAWLKRAENLPLKSPYEALILASIVEKETGLASERPLIAGVFTSRLRKGMKLQTDPTVIYGMGDAYKGNIRRKDLLKDTAYNTYVHTGLTPTPISMPGHDAIDAVLHPDVQGYLYFVAKGDGSHYFSRTLEEHNKAVRKFQLKK
jgi:UPF0755 protein